MRTYEFLAFVRIEAESQHEAEREFQSWLRQPMEHCQEVGAQWPGLPPNVVAEVDG